MPDPNKSTDTIGFNSSSGFYTKEEDGKTLYWIQTQITDVNEGNSKTGDWFESRMANGSINLSGKDSIYDNFTLNLNVYFVDHLGQLQNITYLQHSSGPSDYEKFKVQDSSLASNIIVDLFYRYNGFTSNAAIKAHYNGFKQSANFDQFFKDLKDFVQLLNNGATFSIGKESWEPRKGYDVIWIDHTEAKAMLQKDSSVFRVTEGVLWAEKVIDGKLVVVMATPEKNMNEEQFIRKVLGPLNMVCQEELPSKIPTFTPPIGASYGGLAVKGATIGGHLITTDTITLVPKPIKP